jgi:hypothetical protein
MQNKLTFKQTLLASIGAISSSVILNVIIFYIGQATLVVTDTIFIEPGKNLTILPIIIASIFPTFVACMVFFLLEKYTNNGFKIFTIISIVLGTLSMFSPFYGIPNVPVAFATLLDVMHLVVVLSILFFINRSKKALV